MYFLKKGFPNSTLKPFQRALSNIFKDRSQTFPKSALLSPIGILLLAPYSLKFPKSRNTLAILLFGKPQKEHGTRSALLKNRCSVLALFIYDNQSGCFEPGSIYTRYGCKILFFNIITWAPKCLTPRCSNSNM